jgi:hypothetical protein
MAKFRITYQDGSSKEINAELHQGCLCIKTTVDDGFEYYRRRVNCDPYDDDEPEYETKRRKKYSNDFKPYLNRALLLTDGKMQAAERLSKKNRFSDYAGWEKYFLRGGENEGGLYIEAI